MAHTQISGLGGIQRSKVLKLIMNDQSSKSWCVEVSAFNWRFFTADSACMKIRVIEYATQLTRLRIKSIALYWLTHYSKSPETAVPERFVQVVLDRVIFVLT